MTSDLTDLNKEILELYTFLRNKQNILNESNNIEYSDLRVDREGDILSRGEYQVRHEIVRYGIVSLRNKSIKIKHKYKIRHRII
jgi:hypothetical protein